MPDIHIITVATKPGGYLKWLEQSCKRNGTNLIILGMGSEWQGYITKYILMNEYLNKIPEEDIICFVDAYDVIMLQHIDILRKKFIEYTENTDYKLICAADCTKKTDFLTSIWVTWYYNIRKDQDTIINSGTYIGYAGYINLMYQNMIEIYKSNNLLSDDQFLLNKFYIDHKNEILIDKNNKFFLCEGLQSIIHTKKDSDDFVFIHRPANNEMISVLIQNGYKFDLNEIINLTSSEIQYFIKKSSNHLKHATEFTKAELSKK